MDPFTAIGLAGNILTFIDIGLRLVNQTKGIYDSASDSTAENDSLSVMATRFNTTMIDMQSKIPSGNLSKDEKALKELVGECSSISGELQKLLGALKAKKSNSMRSSMKAALRDWSKKKEKDDLIKRLESSRQQLDLLLSSMTRFESLERLNQLVKYGQSNEAEIASLRSNIDALRSGLQVNFLSPEALDQIRNVVSLSDRATFKVRESCILTALRFQLMEERYDDVAEAHDKTFEWIFDSSNSDDDGRSLHTTSDKPLENPKARAKFMDWVKGGNGIFHISGKPGSGKSTLMKYLCRQEKTKRYLDIWAEDKSLVFGKFFFWNPGTTMQKSLRGLIRGLLYSILSNAPDLIPLAFPKHWDATLSNVTVTFDSSDDILRAFTDLISRDEVYHNHKLVFFIDGLDEFQGDHAALIKKLLRWTSTRPTDVKLCVSSREWPIFQESFKTFPSLRLHELTRSDVSLIVRDRLKNNMAYQKLAGPDELARFESKLVNKSEGVFLWLKLIFQDIEDGLLSGDKLSQLEKKANALPTELNDLFQHLLDSIHTCDRKEAYLIMAVALESPPDWPIFRISFLEEYIENREFALHRKIEQHKEDQIIDRLDRIRKKIYGKCKGLLEIQLIQRRGEVDRTLKESVKFTHRSIVEFLKSDQIKQKLAADLQSLDIFDALCQTFLAHIQATIMHEHYYDEFYREKEPDFRLEFVPESPLNVLRSPSLDYDICTLLSAYAAKGTAPDSARFTAFLENVVEVAEVAEDPFSPLARFQFVDFNWMKEGLTYYTIEVSFSVKMGLFAASYGVSDYALQTHSVGLDSIQEHITLPMLVVLACESAELSDVVRNRISTGLNTILNAYLDLGLDPNGPSAVETTSCWHYVLMRSLHADNRSPYISILASFLLHGANPRFWMKFGARHRLETDESHSIVVIPIEFEWGEERQRLDYLAESRVMVLQLDWPLRMFLERGHVELSCKELLGMMFPQQKTDFQEAIDYILHWDKEVLADDQLRELKERFQPTLGSWINSGRNEVSSANSKSPEFPIFGFWPEERGELYLIDN